jgi:hypothetical protein
MLFKIWAENGKIKVEYNETFPTEELAYKTAKTFWELWPEYLTKMIRESMNDE